jgi:hypothetical protein
VDVVQLSSLRCSAETLAFRRNAGARLRTIGSFPALRFLRSGSRNLRTTPFVDRAPGQSQSRSCTERAGAIRRMSRRAGRCIAGAMKRVVVDHYGGPEVLKVVEDADPRPGRGEVLVRVLAAGVSYTDAMLRVGSYLGVPKPPFTPGYLAVPTATPRDMRHTRRRRSRIVSPGRACGPAAGAQPSSIASKQRVLETQRPATPRRVVRVAQHHQPVQNHRSRLTVRQQHPFLRAV